MSQLNIFDAFSKPRSLLMLIEFEGMTLANIVNSVTVINFLVLR